MKERLLHVETSLQTQYEVRLQQSGDIQELAFQERITELEEEYQERLDSRRSSRSSINDLKRQKREKLVLSVSNLEENFDKVKSFEAELLEKNNRFNLLIVT